MISVTSSSISASHWLLRSDSFMTTSSSLSSPFSRASASSCRSGAANALYSSSCFLTSSQVVCPPGALISPRILLPPLVRIFLPMGTTENATPISRIWVHVKSWNSSMPRPALIAMSAYSSRISSSGPWMPAIAMSFEYLARPADVGFSSKNFLITPALKARWAGALVIPPSLIAVGDFESIDHAPRFSNGMPMPPSCSEKFAVIDLMMPLVTFSMNVSGSSGSACITASFPASSLSNP